MNAQPKPKAFSGWPAVLGVAVIGVAVATYLAAPRGPSPEAVADCIALAHDAVKLAAADPLTKLQCWHALNDHLVELGGTAKPFPVTVAAPQPQPTKLEPWPAPMSYGDYRASAEGTAKRAAGQ